MTTNFWEQDMEDLKVLGNVCGERTRGVPGLYHRQTKKYSVEKY